MGSIDNKLVYNFDNDNYSFSFLCPHLEFEQSYINALQIKIINFDLI